MDLSCWGNRSELMQGDFVTDPLPVRRHSHQAFNPGLGNQESIKGILMQQRELSGFDHMRIQHRQKIRTRSDALITENDR